MKEKVASDFSFVGECREQYYNAAKQLTAYIHFQLTTLKTTSSATLVSELYNVQQAGEFCWRLVVGQSIICMLTDVERANILNLWIFNSWMMRKNELITYSNVLLENGQWLTFFAIFHLSLFHCLSNELFWVYDCVFCHVSVSAVNWNGNDVWSIEIRNWNNWCKNVKKTEIISFADTWIL